MKFILNHSNQLREALLTIKESDSDDESDTEKGEQSEDDESKDVIISDIEVDE